MKFLARIKDTLIHKRFDVSKMIISDVEYFKTKKENAMHISRKKQATLNLIVIPSTVIALKIIDTIPFHKIILFVSN